MTECAALCQYVPLPEPPVCDPTLGISLQREECNNFDEDCDNIVDESLAQGCYTGDPETLFVGVCIPGEVYCDRGSWGNDRNGRFSVGYCAGEITPSPEICDGADNDCDGEVDYGEEIRDTDILFIIDWSASMSEEIRAVRVALGQFAQHFAAEDPLQWGMAVGPKTFRETDDEFLVLVSDISPFEQFMNNFTDLGTNGMDGSLEMLVDALYLSIRNISPAADLDPVDTVWWRNTASLPEKEDFNINWRPDSDRIVIIFSDEPEQTYLKPSNDPEAPRGPLNNNAYVESVIRSGMNLRVYTFSTLRVGRVQSWESMALASGGAGFMLTSDPVSMYNDLMSIIDEACLPRQEQVEQEMGAMRNYNQYIYASYPYGYDYILRICY